MAKTAVKIKIEEAPQQSNCCTPDGFQMSGLPNEDTSSTPVVTGKKVSFSAKTAKKLNNIIKRYPKGREQSASIPALKLAQDEFDGWLSKEAMDLVAETLNMPAIRIYEVATFYTMFNLKPVGKFHLQVCTNCSCMISGSAEIVKALKAETGISENHGTSADGMFTLSEVECLGACVEAPMMQVNSGYHTKLTADGVKDLVQNLRKGKKVKTVTPTKPMKDGY